MLYLCGLHHKIKNQSNTTLASLFISPQLASKNVSVSSHILYMHVPGVARAWSRSVSCCFAWADGNKTASSTDLQGKGTTQPRLARWLWEGNTALENCTTSYPLLGQLIQSCQLGHILGIFWLEDKQGHYLVSEIKDEAFSFVTRSSIMSSMCCSLNTH